MMALADELLLLLLLLSVVSFSITIGNINLVGTVSIINNASFFRI